jgi:hypothetical protein
MAQKTIVVNGSYVPTLKDMEKVDDNFDELYESKSSIESDVTAIEDGTGFALSEYADNAAAVSGGLEIGDLYTTSGAVKVVTA